jgi:protein required for attachment to host cells
MKLRHHDCVVVCDGRKALLFDNVGDHVFPQLVISQVLEQSLLPARAYGNDAPARVHQSVGSARSSIEQRNGHNQAEDAFLRELAKAIDRMLSSSRIGRLIIVAPARALGTLRRCYSNSVRRALVAELQKDLVSESVHTIEKIILRS